MDKEKTLRELARVTTSYHEWWQKYTDGIMSAIEIKADTDSPQKIREYRKLRSAAMTALTDLASFIDENTDEGN